MSRLFFATTCLAGLMVSVAAAEEYYSNSQVVVQTVSFPTTTILHRSSPCPTACSTICSSYSFPCVQVPHYDRSIHHVCPVEEVMNWGSYCTYYSTQHDVHCNMVDPPTDMDADCGLAAGICPNPPCVNVGSRVRFKGKESIVTSNEPRVCPLMPPRYCIGDTCCRRQLQRHLVSFCINGCYFVAELFEIEAGCCDRPKVKIHVGQQVHHCALGGECPIPLNGGTILPVKKYTAIVHYRGNNYRVVTHHAVKP